MPPDSSHPARQAAWILGASILILVIGLSAAAPIGAALRGRAEPPTAIVRRMDLDVTITAPGRLESANNTMIRCELEKLTIEGDNAIGRGSSIIIDLLPEGSVVKERDVLCRLDSSPRDDLVVRQLIGVERARADRRAAELDLDVAQVAFREYHEGVRVQVEQELAGRIAAARADLRMQDERLTWSGRMRQNGYISAAEHADETNARQRAKLESERLLSISAVYRRYTAPKETRVLEARVEVAKATLGFQISRLKHAEERLAYYQLQVGRCTIQAPHDGFLIYANKPGRPPSIVLGGPIRQRQKMFYLPDLSRMEVRALLHETVVARVCAGMSARIRLEARPHQILRGRVASISPLPDHELDTIRDGARNKSRLNPDHLENRSISP